MGSLVKDAIEVKKAQDEKLASIITTIIIKAVVAVVLVRFLLSPGSGVMGYIAFFLLTYALCSLYPFALRLTGNYIITVVVTIILAFGVAWIVDKITLDIFGGNSFVVDLVISIVLLLAV